MTIFGTAGDAFRRAPFFHVGNEPLGRAANVVRIHRVRADTGELRAAHRVRRSALRDGDDSSDCPSAQPARSKRERFVETVVQLIPGAGPNEFGDNLLVESRRSTAKQRANILRSRGDESLITNGALDQSI